MKISAGHPMRKFFFWGKKEPATLFSLHFKTLRDILERNIRILELMADMGEKLSGEYIFDRQYIHSVVEELSHQLQKHISDLDVLEEKKKDALHQSFRRLHDRIRNEMSGIPVDTEIPFTRPLKEPLTVQNHEESELGSENIMMGELHHSLQVNVPDGFFVTTRAFFEYMEYNKLVFHAKACFEKLDKGDGKEAEKALKDLRSMIIGGEIPAKLADRITTEAERLNSLPGRKKATFAVRGCEWSRDKDSALKLPFKTYLNVPPKKIVSVYKEMIAGFLCSSGLRHYPGDHYAVSAGFYTMVDAGTSGFIQTLDPVHPEKGIMIIGATPGLGGQPDAAGGNIDHYVISHDPPYPVLSMDIIRKDRMLTLRGDDGTQWMNIPHYTCRAPSLRADQIPRLAETAVLIERYFKRPLEILWCLDKEENLFILKTRVLNLPAHPSDTILPVEKAIQNARVLFSGKGMVVQSGIATGKVQVVRNEEDLDRFPSGAILVSAMASPRFSRAIRKATGILTGIGSPTGHMASMARELRVPAIVNCGDSVKQLKTGDEITIDASYNIVYSGVVRELQRYELMEESLFEESSEYLLLRRLVRHICPLNLIDPHNRNFSPDGCCSYHDIMRYVHQKAIQKIIDLSARYQHRAYLPVSRLETGIPLGIFIAQIDENRRPGSGSVLKEEDLESVPMRALLSGLHESGMWCTRPLSVDMGSFMSSLTRTFSYSLSMPDEVGMNLALISGEYMNLNLRLGYHYTIIDALISDRSEENRISFRFFGGVTGFSRRSMRVKFIGKILEKFDFRVELHGDLVVGRFKKASKPRMIGKMKIIGGLIGYTRQLDVQLGGERCLESCVEDFMHQIKRKMEVEGE